jgi:SAM-dependent methyltransferase
MQYADWITKYYDYYVRFDSDIPFFLKELAGIQGEVLELMSGTGRLSVPLVEAGIRLTCVDSSSPMLGILHRKLASRKLTASLIQQDICELKLDKRYKAIIIPFHSFAEIHAVEDQAKVLRKIHEHLDDNGCFICTLHNPPIRIKTVTGGLRLIGKYPVAGRKRTLLVWSNENYNQADHTVEGVQIYEEYDQTGTMLSRKAFDIRFSLLERKQFEDAAISAGFKVRHIYGDYSWSLFQEQSSPVMIFILSKCR